MPDPKLKSLIGFEDSRGMTPVDYAALQTAAVTQRLAAELLGEEEPPPKESEQLTQLLEAMQAMAAAIGRIEQRQLELARQIAALPGTSAGSPPRRA